MYPPIRYEEEVFSEDPTEPIRWVEREDPSGIFQILVPDLPQAAEVVLVSSPLEPELAYKPAMVLARFPLQEEPKGSEEAP
jgi:hypothetical protein